MKNEAISKLFIEAAESFEFSPALHNLEYAINAALKSHPSNPESLSTASEHTIDLMWQDVPQQNVLDLMDAVAKAFDVDTLYLPGGWEITAGLKLTSSLYHTEITLLVISYILDAIDETSKSQATDSAVKNCYRGLLHAFTTSIPKCDF